MILDVDALLKLAKEVSNAPLAKNERPSTYSIEPYERHLTSLLALKSLDAKVDESLQDAKIKLAQDYTLSGVTPGAATSRMKCDEFVSTINQAINVQMGKAK